MAGTFSVESNKAKKTVTLTFNGFFITDEAERFAADYSKAVQEVGQSTATLILDAANLSIFPQDKVPLVVEFYKDYGKFKEIYAVKPKSATAYMQMQTNLKEAGILAKVKFVETLPVI